MRYLSLPVLVVLVSSVVAGTSELRIDSVDPPTATAGNATEIVLAGQGFVPGTEPALLDGGPYRVGGVDTGGDAVAAAARGRYAYVADSQAGLQVIDVADPSSPQRIGGLETLDPITHVALLDPYVLILAAGLHVVDVSDPANPERVASLSVVAWAMAVQGHHVFIAGDEEMLVVDLSDPLRPRVVGATGLPRTARYIAVQGDLACLAWSRSSPQFYPGIGELYTVSVETPDAPRLLGKVPTRETKGLAMAGHHAFVAAVGLQVFDLSRPGGPELAAWLPMPRTETGLAVRDRHVFMGLSQGGMRVIDVVDPSRPRLVAKIRVPGSPLGVALSDDHAYLPSRAEGLQVVNVARKRSVLRRHVWYKHSPRDAWTAKSVAVSGELAVVVEDTFLGSSNISTTLRFVDSRNPAVLLSSYWLGGRVNDAIIQDGLLYLGNRFSGLVVFDIANPRYPVLIAAEPIPGMARGLEVRGDVSYVAADTTGGLQVVDVRDPSAPEILGGCDVPGEAQDVVEHAPGHLLVASGSAGLVVVDASLPMSPTVVGQVPTPNHALQVATDGTYAFVATGESGLLVIDPATEEIIAAFATSGPAVGVTVHDGRAYVAMRGAGVEIIDIGDPYHPVLAGRHEASYDAREIVVSGGSTYVADGLNGLLMWNDNPPVADVQVLSDTEMRIKIPAAQSPGPYHVGLTRPDGETTILRNGFNAIDSSILETPLAREARWALPVP